MEMEDCIAYNTVIASCCQYFSHRTYNISALPEAQFCLFIQWMTFMSPFFHMTSFVSLMWLLMSAPSPCGY